MIRILYLHGFASGPFSTKARYFRDLLERAGARVDVPDLAAGDFENLTGHRTTEAHRNAGGGRAGGNDGLEHGWLPGGAVRRPSS